MKMSVIEHETWPLFQMRRADGQVLAEAECAERPGERGREWFVQLRGDLDAMTVPRLRDALAALTDDGRVIRIDMSQVDFMDSSGAGLIVEAHRLVAAHGAHLELLDPSPGVRRVLEILGLDAVVAIGDTAGPD